jgi:hypothetical protein
MSIKKGQTGTGSYHNDVTEDLNKAAFNKTKRNIEASDAWRKAKQEDPRLEFRMSFVDFKRIYFSRKKKSGRKKISKP